MPTGLCYGDEKIYVADYGYGAVYTVDDDEDAMEDPVAQILMQGAFAIFCVNSSVAMAVSLLVLAIF